MMNEMLFRKSTFSFFMNIDNKSTIHNIALRSSVNKFYAYKIVNILKYNDLVTRHPFQLTKKGELLKIKLKRIKELIDDGYK